MRECVNETECCVSIKQEYIESVDTTLAYITRQGMKSERASIDDFDIENEKELEEEETYHTRQRSGISECQKMKGAKVKKWPSASEHTADHTRLS